MNGIFTFYPLMMPQILWNDYKGVLLTILFYYLCTLK